MNCSGMKTNSYDKRGKMNTKQTEALSVENTLKLALEALEEINKLSIGKNAICLPAEIDTAMDAIREALAEQPAQQQCKGIPRKGCNYLTACDTVCNKCGEIHHHHQMVANFDAPASKPLTDEEIVQIELGLRQYNNRDTYDLSLKDFARAIEAKLREKNA